VFFCRNGGVYSDSRVATAPYTKSGSFPDSISSYSLRGNAFFGQSTKSGEPLIEERALVKTYSNGKNGARENLEGGLDECEGSVSTERCVKKWSLFAPFFCLLVRWRMTTFLFALPQTLFFGLRR
jgi:hypothetical protein